MNKLINDRMYDTERAKMLGEWSNDLPYNDLHYVYEALYRKRTGEYFLHVIGGAATKYSVTTGFNSWAGGEKIIPLLYEEAHNWGVKRLSSTVYNKEFGEIKQNNKVVMLTVSMRTSDAEKLRRAARENDLKLSEYVSKLVNLNIRF